MTMFELSCARLLVLVVPCVSADRLPADMTDQEMAAVSSAVFDELMGKNYPTNTTFDLGTRAPPHHECDARVLGDCCVFPGAVFCCVLNARTTFTVA